MRERDREMGDGRWGTGLQGMGPCNPDGTGIEDSSSMKDSWTSGIEDEWVGAKEGRDRGEREERQGG